MLKRSKTILLLLLCGLLFINVKAQDSTTIKSQNKTDSSMLDTVMKTSNQAVLRKDSAAVKVETIPIKGNGAVFKDKNNYLHDGLFFLSGCVCIMLIWLITHLINRKRSKKMNSQFEDEYLNRKIIASSPEVKELKRTLAEMDIKLKMAEDTITKLQKQLEHSLAQYSILEGKKNIAPGIEVREPDLLQEQHSPGYLYFPSPLSDGSFRKIDGRTSFSEGASIYRFKLISDTNALFEFCEDNSSVSMALNNRNDLILSVAEEMEGHYSGAKRVMIYQGKMGRVQLVDNKWLLVQKAQIKYV